MVGRGCQNNSLPRSIEGIPRKAGHAEASNQLKDDFVTQFNQGLVWLMLDGVDEMQTQESNPLEEIERQIRMGALLQQSRIVISCRLNLWDNGINALESFDNYRTLDFSYPQQVEEFICKWFSSQSPAEMQTGQQLCVALRDVCSIKRTREGKDSRFSKKPIAPDAAVFQLASR
ncbi:NACHT domain-containing protein [Nostoc sp.]|uniref:NACHT domain-containing protein n=1 Tax=Nostoc sp. TaxID=1180 RepID=UPI002FF21424